MTSTRSEPGVRRRRVLFIAEAVSLAHVSRPVQLALGLDEQRYERHLAWDNRFAALFGDLPLTQHPIDSISCQQFMDALASGRPLYDQHTLREYVWHDMTLLDRVRPDAVVGDFRLSLAVSARLQGVPYLTISNAYWSPYASVRCTVPALPMVRWLGVRAAQALFSAARPLAFALHAIPMQRLRREHGLVGVGYDLRRAYTDADWTLYADVPELAPLHDAPANHVFLGPIPWSPTVPLPAWWNELDRARPVVYATPGSTGRQGLLDTVLAALADLPVTVIAASAGQALAGPTPANAKVERYLPGLAAAARAQLTICNGGSPTTYQALAAGKPVLAMPSNLDQFLNMQGIERCGAGLTLRADHATASAVRHAVQRLLQQPAFTTAAQGIAAACARYDSAAILDSVLERALAD